MEKYKNEVVYVQRSKLFYILTSKYYVLRLVLHQASLDYSSHKYNIRILGPLGREEVEKYIKNIFEFVT